MKHSKKERNFMGNEELLKKHCMLLKTISSIPRKIVTLNGTDNTSEFVLHELCKKDCFDLKKAAYFIDNPDFNCLKGIAGFCSVELDGTPIDWSAPHQFSQTMQSSPFNTSVRSVLKDSYKKKYGNNKLIVDDLVSDLGFENHSVCVWPLKHDNSGLLVYEKGDLQDTFVDDHLIDALFLLSFCPVF